jgi:Activator of Hsp90 ATPase homolog 1-like protein
MAAIYKTTSGKSVFEMTRAFRAPRERVWKAWSDADQLKHWWRPKGCAIEIAHLAFRLGGFFHYAMKFEGAPTMWGRFNYREIIAPERIVWLNSFSNEKCGIARKRMVPLSSRGEPEAQVWENIVRQPGLEWTCLRARWFARNFSERAAVSELSYATEEIVGRMTEKGYLIHSCINGTQWI